jgi:hypothetical protein
LDSIVLHMHFEDLNTANKQITLAYLLKRSLARITAFEIWKKRIIVTKSRANNYEQSHKRVASVAICQYYQHC